MRIRLRLISLSLMQGESRRSFPFRQSSGLQNTDANGMIVHRKIVLTREVLNYAE